MNDQLIIASSTNCASSKLPSKSYSTIRYDILHPNYISCCTFILTWRHLWAFFVCVQTMVRYSTEQHKFLVESSIRKKFCDVFINFFDNITFTFTKQIICFKAVQKNGIKADPLLIGRDISETVCWHQKLSKTSNQAVNWVKRKSHPLIVPRNWCL